MDTIKTDILIVLRNVIDGIFMAKRWKPVVAQNDGEILTVKEMLPLILNSVRMKETIQLISKTTKKSERELRQTVSESLQKVGHYRSMIKIRCIGTILCYIIKKNYSQIFVNEISVNHVKEIMGKNPVIFAPSHKSYADFILMSFLCFYYDIEIPVIAAGEDFRSMWLMSKVLRDCCAFFIKRSFVGDELYKASIAEYISLVITRGHAAFEFFIEGKRSRSGKSVSPKYGLMTMALEPYFLGKVPDITIVPINITYERVLEDHLFARELLGIPKPKETTLLLLKALQLINDNYGRIFVEFGNPISVHQFSLDTLGKDLRLDLNLCDSRPVYPQPEISKCVKTLCHRVISEQNKNVSFTCINLLAASLSIWIAYEKRVNFERIVPDIVFLHKFLNKLGYSVMIKESIVEELSDCVKLHHRILHLESPKGPLKLKVGMPSVSSGALSVGQQLSEGVVSEVYPTIILQEYANPVCLAVVHVAIVNFVLCTTPSDKLHLISQESLYEDYLLWRKILSTEFVFQEEPSVCKEEFARAVDQMRELDIFFCTSDGVSMEMDTSSRRNDSYEAVFLGLIQPFFFAYMFALEVCITVSNESCLISEKDLKLMMQKNFEEQIVVGVPMSILSLDIIQNVITTFCIIGALEKWQKNGVNVIRVLIDECSFYHNDIAVRLGYLRQHLKDCHEKAFSQNLSAASKL